MIKIKQPPLSSILISILLILLLAEVLMRTAHHADTHHVGLVQSLPMNQLLVLNLGRGLMNWLPSVLLLLPLIALGCTKTPDNVLAVGHLCNAVEAAIT